MRVELNDYLRQRDGKSDQHTGYDSRTGKSYAKTRNDLNVLFGGADVDGRWVHTNLYAGTRLGSTCARDCGGMRKFWVKSER